MNRRNVLSFTCALCLFCVISGCRQNEKQHIVLTSFAPHKEAEVDTFLHQLKRTFPIPGIAIAIVKDNQVLYRTVGERDHESQLPLLPSTPMFMGNISELMTATGIMKLAQSGKIKLDDPVSRHLPYFRIGDTLRTEIQIRHLLTHTSGVPHHDAVWDLPTFDSTALEFTTASISRQPPEFKPAGSRVKRSQYNFDILADLIEKASGKRFEDYMNTEVLQAMGMNHAAYYDTAIQTDEVAQPHRISNWLTYDLATADLYPQNREHAGSIGFHASVEDLVTWMSMMLHDGQVAEKSFLGEAIHRDFLNAHFKTGQGNYVGYGWEIRDKDSIRYYNKSHYIGGFSGDITLIPQKHIGIVVISNIADEFDPDVISDQIIQWLSGRKFDTPKEPVNLVMGKELEKTKSLDKTLALYHNLKQSDPERYDFSHTSLSKLGVNLMHRLHRKEDAIKLFAFILQQHPSSPYAHLNLAEAYVVNNDIQKAEAQLKEVKALPVQGDGPIQQHLAYLEEAIGIMKEEKHEMPAEIE